LENVVDYLVVAAYFVGILAAGYVGLRMSRTTEDFLVAGRRLGPFMYIGAISAVVLGGAATIGGVALGYQYGISGAWLVISLAAGIIAIGLFFSTRLSRLGVYTVAETVGLRYGLSSRRLSALIVAFYALTVGVGQVIAIGTIFNVLLGLSPTVSILIGWSVIMVYCVAGGMWSITLTDVVQFCIMTVGIFFVLLPLAILRAGGFSGMAEELPASYFSPVAIGGATIFAYFLLFFFGFMIDQGNWQRVFTARSEKVAFWGCIASGVYCLLYGLAGALIGAAARVLLPNLANADNAFAEVAQAVLPTGLLGLVMAAALAAVMSTASGLFIGSSTVLVNDLYDTVVQGRRNNVRNNRIALVLVGVVALVLSFLLDSVVGAVTVAADLLAAALFVPVVGALFWKRATKAGALASMVVSSVVVVVFMFVSGLYANEPVIYGLLASLVVFVGVSLLTPRTSREDLTAWERRMEERPAVVEEA
jgi:SSS family solute:Na+ symporter